MLKPGVYRIKNVRSGFYLGADENDAIVPQGFYENDSQKARVGILALLPSLRILI